MENYLMVMMFIIGTVFGSFYNVCIYRIPEKLSVHYPESHCYNCKSKLRYKDLIPVLSWICLKGRCRYCNESISARYLVIEILTGILFLTIYIKFGYEVVTIYYILFLSVLLIISFIDIDHYIIPDELIMLGIVVSIIFNSSNDSIQISILSGIVCGIVPLTAMLVIEFISKKDMMGGGDIKLYAIIGLFLGLELGILTIILSIYVGAIYGILVILYTKLKNIEYKSMIPYGPFISISAIISIMQGNNIIKLCMELLI